MLGSHGPEEKYDLDFPSFGAPEQVQVAPSSPLDPDSASSFSMDSDDDDDDSVSTSQTTSLVIKSKTSKKVARNHPNRNALMAKANRERKKAYVSELEAKLHALEEKCKKLEKETTHQKNSLSKANAHIQMLQLTMKNSATLKPVLDALAGASFPPNQSDSKSMKNLSAAGQHDVIPLQLNIFVNRK